VLFGMSRNLKILFVLLVALHKGYGAEPVKNIIFMIGDGMGFQQVRAAAMYNGGPLCFESFPYTAQQTTFSLPANSLTDSAAAATALATGVKVNNSVISLRIPGDAARLETILEYAKKRGRRTGLVTTVTMTHATPAGFGAHATNRSETARIASEYLNSSRPNVLLGGGGAGMNPVSAVAAGYTVVTNLAGMQAINPDAVEFLSGQFGSAELPYETEWSGSLPHLSQMTASALDLLDNDPDGFFLMVEGGLIDYAGHANNIQRLIGETLEFGRAVAVVTNWATGRTDTLVLVTADHETGGLFALTNNGAGIIPSVVWTSGTHTVSNVPVYAWGDAGSYVSGTIDNTRHFAALTEAMLAPASNLTLQVGDSSPISVGGGVISGAVYRLESRESLVTGQWSFVQSSTATAPVIVLSDTNTSASRTRFYRFISIP